MPFSMYQPANIAVSVLFQQVFQTFYGVLDVLGILFHLLNVFLHLLNSLLASFNLLFNVLFHVLNSLYAFLNFVSHSLLASLVLSLQLIVLVESSLELLGSLEVLSLGGYGLSAYLLGLCCLSSIHGVSILCYVLGSLLLGLVLLTLGSLATLVTVTTCCEGHT